jgi:cell division protein FtsB
MSGELPSPEEVAKMADALKKAMGKLGKAQKDLAAETKDLEKVSKENKALAKDLDDLEKGDD